MEKKFEKKTMFEKKTRNELFIESHKDVLYPRLVLLNYAEAANAEIDRLNTELAALRPQQVERVWISSETHESHVSVEAGLYMRVHRETGNVAAIFCESGDALPVTTFDYTLILAKADFPVPPKPEPKPLEVKVGKYDFPTKGIGEIVCIQGDHCWFINPGGGHQAVCYLNDIRDHIAQFNAVFIGEGDNQ